MYVFSLSGFSKCKTSYILQVVRISEIIYNLQNNLIQTILEGTKMQLGSCIIYINCTGLGVIVV